jgi:ribulose-phosphate 3-epimerase
MRQKTLIAPSILSADFSNLMRDIEKVKDAGADWLHIDVMDGHFVPNITIGAPVISSIRKISDLFFDVHLMISDPLFYLEDFIKAGANLITFHKEVQTPPPTLIQAIKKSGIKAGISIKPATPISDIADFIAQLDLVLIMSVEPGFGGQSFIESSLEKIAFLRKTIDENGHKCLIEVDGGINDKTAARCIEAGADILVSGSFIFAAQDMKGSIDKLRFAQI